jgi:hypothetical protein
LNSWMWLSVERTQKFEILYSKWTLYSIVTGWPACKVWIGALVCLPGSGAMLHLLEMLLQIHPHRSAFLGTWQIS